VAGSGIGAIAHLGTAFINRPKNPPVNNQPAAAPVNSQTNAATPANNKPDNEQPTATTPAKNQSTAKAPADNQSAAKNPIDVAVAPSNPTAKLLAEWGWTKVACYPGAVFIMGMSDDAICVNPSAAIVGGQYQYDRASNQLIPLAASNPAPAPVSNPAAAAVEPAEQPPSDVVPVQEAEPQDADVF